MKNLDEINANILWISNVIWPGYIYYLLVVVYVPLINTTDDTLKSKKKEMQVELQRGTTKRRKHSCGMSHIYY